MTTTGPGRRFTARTALVTGAGGGIGSAISRRLTAEGAHVSMADANETTARQVTADLVAEGLNAQALVFDLLDPSACAGAVTEIIEGRGTLDVMVNNAGVNRRGDLLSLTRSRGIGRATATALHPLRQGRHRNLESFRAPTVESGGGFPAACASK